MDRKSRQLPTDERKLDQIRLPAWGRVVPAQGGVAWVLVDDAGAVFEPVHRFMVDFVARGNRTGSVRSYEYGLLRWLRWLRAVDVRWDRATPDEARDYVLWLQQAFKPARSVRTVSVRTAGTVNPATGKAYLDDRYKPRTMRHGLAVVRAFYEYWGDRGSGPVLNPVQRVNRHIRPNAHHNPLQWP